MSLKKESSKGPQNQFKVSYLISSAPNTVLMNSKDMKGLDLGIAESIKILSNDVSIVLNAWPSKAVASGALVLNKAHSRNFDGANAVKCEKLSLSEKSMSAKKIKLSYNNSTGEPLPRAVKDVLFSYLMTGLYIVTQQQFTVMNTMLEVDGISAYDSQVDRSRATFYTATKDTVLEYSPSTFETVRGPLGIDSTPRLKYKKPAAYESEFNKASEYITWAFSSKSLSFKDAETESEHTGYLSFLDSIMKPPRGLLVHGSAGVGKSAFVKSVAYSTGRPVFEIGPGLLLKRNVGEAEQELTFTFVDAIREAPSCILFDDLDLIAPSRKDCVKNASAVSDVQMRVVTSLLRLIDELASRDVFLIGSSSRPSNIDSAMRRPGRFDKEIELTVPTAAQRELILRDVMQDFGISIISSPDVRSTEEENTSRVLRKVADVSHGMVASDLISLVKEACHLSLDPQAAKRLTGDVDSIDRDFEKISLSPLPITSPSETHNDRATGLSVTERDLLEAAKRVSPSALKEIVLEVPTVRWDMVGGMDGVKESLKEVVEWPLKYPGLFRALGVPPPRGVLLYGPPGCSKTLMAKCLATESSMNFLAVRGPELLSKWLGESEKAVQLLFKRARAVAPCVVFFDEIDAFAVKRGGSSAGVNDRVLSQLLTELDGIERSNRVIIVAATNRPDLLDAALLRPGRLDRKIYVNPPDPLSRDQIFRLEMRKLGMTIVPLEDLVWLAQHSEGFSGAEIVSCCQEAAMLSIDEGLDQLSMELLRRTVVQLKPQLTLEMLQFYERMRSVLS